METSEKEGNSSLVIGLSRAAVASSEAFASPEDNSYGNSDAEDSALKELVRRKRKEREKVREPGIETGVSTIRTISTMFRQHAELMFQHAQELDSIISNPNVGTWPNGSTGVQKYKEILNRKVDLTVTERKEEEDYRDVKYLSQKLLQVRKSERKRRKHIW